MKFSDGLFLEVARKVAEDYPDIEFEDRIIDNLCNQLVSRPEEYDVIVLPEPLRRHRLRPRRRHDRRPRPGAGRQHRQRGGDVRGHPRLGPEVQGAEQGEPDRADAVRAC